MPNDPNKIRFAFHTHGLGDCVHCATAMRLYIDRGYDVAIQVEPNKRWIWEAAGIPIWEKSNPQDPDLPLHPYYYPDDFFNLSKPDHLQSKIAHLFEVELLPKLGTKEEVWRMVCNQRVDAAPAVSPEAMAEATTFLEGLPKPIILLHSKGTNWQEEKSIPDTVAFRLMCELVNSFGGSIVTLDWDARAATLGHERVRSIRPYWNHLPLEVFGALCRQSDLLIGVDSGPFHLAGWFELPTLFVARKIPPVRCCLPSPNATYLVPAKDHDNWISRSSDWKWAEFAGGEATVQDIVVNAMSIITPQPVRPTGSTIIPDVPGRYIYRRVDHDERPIELLPSGKIGEGAGGCELVWKIERTPAGPVLTIYGHHGGATCHLSPCADGVYRGRWLAHEKMPIELIPDRDYQQPPETVTWNDLVSPTDGSRKRRFVVGIPTLNRYDLLEKCLAACRASSVTPERIIIIDNGGGFTTVTDVIRPARNIGVAASWNMIHRLCQPLDLIILNDDIEPGHNLFEKMLDCPESFVTADESHMFEAFLMRQDVWDVVGEFDETFYPAYHEDNDYFMRMRLANVAIGWTPSDGVKQNGPSASKAHFTPQQMHDFHAQFDAGRKYYVQKWGGAPHVETFSKPFDGKVPRA